MKSIFSHYLNMRSFQVTALFAAMLLVISTGIAQSGRDSILLLTPQNGVQNATTDEIIMIHFTSDAKFDASGELTILESDGSEFEKISFDSDRVIDLNSGRIMIKPKKDFEMGKQYSIRLKSSDSEKAVIINGGQDWQFRVNTQLEQKILHSKSTDEEHRLLIRLPKKYKKDIEKRYPVIYVTDGGFFNRNQYAEISDAIAVKDIPDAIVVGLTYPDRYGLDDIRQFRGRDLCRPSHIRFARFLRTELIPYINEHYRTDPTMNTLMGNSCGGFFTTSMVFQYQPGEASQFKNYISVAQLYDFEKELKKFDQRITSLPINYHLSIGDQDTPDRITAFKSLVTSLSDKNYQGFRFESRITKGAPHGEVSSTPNFKEGLKLFLSSEQ